MRSPLQLVAMAWCSIAVSWAVMSPSVWSTWLWLLALAYVSLCAIQAVVGWPADAPSGEERADIDLVRTTLDLDLGVLPRRGADPPASRRRDAPGAG